MTFDIKAAIAAAKSTTPDMTVAQKGGGDYKPPAEGKARARFIGYYELGDHTQTVPGKPDTVKAMVRLVFELSGSKHAPAQTDNGPVPHRLSIDVPYSLNEKANFYKIFTKMNWEGKATHIAELLGGAYLVDVHHKKNEDGSVKYATLKGPDGYGITAPRHYDPIAEVTQEVPVDPPITKLGLFLWDYPSKEMWDALHIPGTYDDGKSKNVLQDKIKSALNFQGSPLHTLLLSGTTAGLELGGGAAPAEPQPAASTASTAQPDPLAGM